MICTCIFKALHLNLNEEQVKAINEYVFGKVFDDS